MEVSLVVGWSRLVRSGLEGAKERGNVPEKRVFVNPLLCYTFGTYE